MHDKSKFSAQNKLRAIFLLLISMLAIVTLLILSSSVNDNSISIKSSTKYRVNKLIPQGWSFFTRNPQEEDYFVYKFDSKTNSLTLVNETLSSFSNLLGLKRIHNNSGIELGYINTKIKKAEWIKINGKLKRVNVDSLKPVRIINSFPFPTIFGSYVIQKKNPIPLIWAKKFKTEMPSEIVLINVIKNPKKR